MKKFLFLLLVGIFFLAGCAKNGNVAPGESCSKKSCVCDHSETGSCSKCSKCSKGEKCSKCSKCSKGSKCKRCAKNKKSCSKDKSSCSMEKKADDGGSCPYAK